MADEKEAKASDVIAAVERFFLDLIGTVIPGFLLIVGWVILFGQPRGPGVDLFTTRDVLVWLVPVLSYVLGRFVTGVGYQLVGWASSVLPFVKSDDDVDKEIGEGPSYKSFVQGAKQQYPWLATIPEGSVRAWRSVAMSLISEEDNHKVYRFMFISLLNLGAGTVCVLLFLAWLAATIAAKLPFLQSWGSVLFAHRQPLDLGVLLITIVLTYFFFERRGEFYPRALRVPFSMASVKLTKAESTRTQTPSLPPTGLVLYLAGGSHSGWQDAVIAALPRWRILDPRGHGLTDERAYTLWDLDAVRRSDYVLAYLEATNPAGYNLALELGYAKALGKRIVFIDAKSGGDARHRRYVSMLHAVADANPTTLDEAIAFMQHVSIATNDADKSL